MSQEQEVGVFFQEALNMVLQPKTMDMDWDNYYKAAKEIGMGYKEAQNYYYKYKREIGA